MMTELRTATLKWVKRVISFTWLVSPSSQNSSVLGEIVPACSFSLDEGEAEKWNVHPMLQFYRELPNKLISVPPPSEH